MAENEQRFQHIMIYGQNSTEAQKNCVIYEEGSMNNRTCQKWFAKFYNG